MFKNNSFITGLISGLLIPAVAFAIFYFLLSNFGLVDANPASRLNTGSFLRTSGIVAIGLNAIPMNIAFKKKHTNTMRGIVIPTFVYVFLWLYYYGDVIMKSFG